MPSNLPHWTKLPSGWIDRGGLKDFRWTGGEGSDYQAALMAFTVILNHAQLETGIARLTYDDLGTMASLSRAKLAAGLDVLDKRGLIERAPEGRSTYRVANHGVQSGWAMFPAKGIYVRGAVAAFANFNLRQRAELDALKLYFLFAARRTVKTNAAHISYDKIEAYSGVSREHIKRALSLLTVNSLVYTDRIVSTVSEEGFSHAYRLVHLNPRQHMGTTGRGADPLELANAEIDFG